VTVFGKADECAVLETHVAFGEGNSPVAECIRVNFDVMQPPGKGVEPVDSACGGFLEKTFLGLEVVRAKEESFGPVERVGGHGEEWFVE
jgi:hypothetical protein